MEITIFTGILIFVLAFFAELSDSSLGMGYGTALSPILLFMGFEPLEVVPAILVSEFITGILAGFAHQSQGNISLAGATSGGTVTLNTTEAQKPSFLPSLIGQDMKTLLLFSACGVIGSLSAAFAAVKLNPLYVKSYIAILILATGLILIITRNKKYSFSWKRLGAVGLIASFNKGISGGGYGPLVTGGQILSGVPEKKAIALTSFSEGITCLAGVIIYMLYNNPFQSPLLPILVCAGAMSVPFAALFVKKINTQKLRGAVGWVTLGLGIFSLSKIIFAF
ncbi:MAG: sulfite exporter TauE/SafE family protein [Spirochaetales bacterium]|nr:sulfite exporter TauE/SafE family protein [Spirochaetales bacterium]